jgi:mercuric ion binding protein
MKKLILLSLLPIVALATTKVATLDIKGMTCLLCTTAVKRSLKHTQGVTKVKVHFNTKEAVVTYDDTKTEQKDLLNAVKKTGYSAKIKEVK